MKLLEPTKLGNLNLSNKMVMAPMTRSRALNNTPNEWMSTYYKQRSSAGLIITEGTSPSPNGLGYAFIPGIYSQDQINGWKQVTKAVHEEGGKIFVQLMHTGRISVKENLPEGASVLAPSTVQAKGQMWSTKGMLEHPVPVAMSKEDIQNAIQEFVQAAKNAIESGFDGVELHSANGYLLNQFLSTNANLRTDEYGGNYENRARFVIEVAKAVVDAIGSDKVGIKLSPGVGFNDIEVKDASSLYPYLVKKLSELNLLFLDIVRVPNWEKSEEGFDVLSVFRELYNGTIIFGGGFTRDEGESLLQTGKVDLIAYGNYFISNPDLPERFKVNAELNPAKQELFYAPVEEGYTDYPFLK